MRNKYGPGTVHQDYTTIYSVHVFLNCSSEVHSTKLYYILFVACKLYNIYSFPRRNPSILYLWLWFNLFSVTTKNLVTCNIIRALSRLLFTYHYLFSPSLSNMIHEQKRLFALPSLWQHFLTA